MLRSKLAQAVALIAIIFAVFWPMAEQAYTAMHAIVTPVSASEVDEPFHEALDSIPAGSRILFVGNQDAPDYPLFSLHGRIIRIGWSPGARLRSNRNACGL